MATTSINRQGAWILAGALVAAAGLAFVMTSGGGRSPAAVERVIDPGPDDERAPVEATLDAPAAVSDAARTAVHATGAAEDPGAASAQDAERCVVEGIVLVPRGFSEPELFAIGAWALGDGAPSAPILGVPRSDRTFRFEGVPAGDWTFVARVEREGRIAWGRSESVTAVPGSLTSGVRIELQEYVVEGIVTDRGGIPLAGLPVAYRWRGSDDFAGRSLEVDPPEEASTNTDIAEAEPTIPTEVLAPPPRPEEIAEANRAMEEAVRALENAMRESGSQLVGLGYSSDGAASAPDSVWIQTVPNGGEALVLDAGSLRLNGDGFSTGEIVFQLSSNVNHLGDGRVRGETVVTDAAGGFRIALEGPGSVAVTAPGRPEEGEREWVPKEESVALTVEAPRGNTEFELQRAAYVEGRVIRSDAEPGRISVFLRRVDGGGTKNRTTDEDGVFKFGELVPGRYLFYARNGGRQGQDYSLHLEVDVSEGGTAVVDDVLTPSSSVVGEVRDVSGQPLAGARVTARGAINDNLTRSATTDDSGRFEIIGMYACDYVLSVNGRELTGEHGVTVPPKGVRVAAGVLEVE